ncbi:MAG TPA: kelch repeat-containing protein, partial [Solirubrobacteraceae bacterium]
MTRGLSLLAIALLVVGGCLGAQTRSRAPADPDSPGRWESRKTMTWGRQEVAVGAVGGKVYVIGGFGSTAEPVDIVEVFDSAADEWRTVAPLPIALHHAAAAVVDGRLFVVGGYTGGRVRWSAVGTVFEYEPARNAWRGRAQMPTPRGALAVAALAGRVYALGGSAERVSNAHEVYDVASDRWAPANAMPTARDHLAAVGFEGRVWTLGGRESFLGTQYANVEIYDPTTDSWRTGTPLPGARGGLAAAALGDRILVFGGEAPLRIWNATEMYDRAIGAWTAKAPMPTARHGLGAVVVDGRIYVVGGGREPGFAPTDV